MTARFRSAPDDPAARRPAGGSGATRHDVVVVGAGVIGLSVAWSCAARGLSVAVVDPAPGRGSSWVAAGMLAPVSEVRYGEEALLELNLASARRWPAFAAELSEASGRDIGYWRCGTLIVAGDDDDRAWAEELFSFQRELGLEVSWHTGRAARDLEPALSPGVRAGIWVAGDHQVDNRLLLGALEAAAAKSGVDAVPRAATRLELSGGSVDGVRLDDDTVVRAGAVVLAAGCWSGGLAGLPPDAVPAVRPVKGQIIRLVVSERAPRLTRTVRGVVQGASVYLVPRHDGTAVLGSTVEEQGFDTTVTAGAVYELLRDAHRVVPGVTEMEVLETSAGLRPGSPDNAPIVGPCAVLGARGLVLATGHYRNGFLLTPVTAASVTAYVTGDAPPPEIEPFGPARFASSPADTAHLNART